MENSQNGNGKNKSSNNRYINELNKLIYAGAKLICEKIGVLLKVRRKNQPEWKILVETQIKKSTKTGKNDKTKEKKLEHVGTKRKKQHKKK